MVSGELPETMRKLCLSTKFPHQEIRWNYGILRSDSYFTFSQFMELGAISQITFPAIRNTSLHKISENVRKNVASPNLFLKNEKL